MYQSVWKCRLCSQRFVGEATYDDEEAEKVMFELSMGKDIKSSHRCYGGSLGVADFVGFEHIRDEK